MLLGLAGLAAGCVTSTPWTGAGSISCPVTGTVSFRDDFGEDRGDHTHQGIDIFANRGRANVAVVDGKLEQRFDATGGGNTLWLTDSKGTRYVYMHLDRFQGAPRTVKRNEVIGYTGSTGNVSGGTHTHFEIRPNAGAPVTPYDTLLKACPNRT